MVLAALLVCMLGPPPGAGATTAFPVEPLPRVKALRRVSGDVLVASTEDGVHVLERGAAAPRRVVPYADRELLDARESGGVLELVYTGVSYGPIVRQRVDGRAEAELGRQVERPEDVGFVDVALAGDGSTYVLERDHGEVWTWSGSGAELRKLAGGGVSALLTDEAGQVWFVTDGWRVTGGG